MIYATPVATPFIQDIPAPATNSAAHSNMPAVVVVSPAVTENPVIVITPAPTEAPLVELPAVTDAPALEVLPAVTDAPVTEAPAVTEAPVTEVPAVTEAPVTEVPAVTETPVTEAPAVTEAPVMEVPAVTEAPVMELPAVSDETVLEFAPVPELPALDIPMEEQFGAEFGIPGENFEEAPPTEQESFAEETPMDDAAGPVVASHDFSMLDCGEFVDALFTSKKADESSTAQEAAAQSGDEQTDFVSYVDQLIALKAVELCTLPENIEAQRIETVSFSVEGQFFTVQISVFGEDIYVQSYTGDGSPVCFRTAMTVAEYDGFVALCYTLNENVQ